MALLSPGAAAGPSDHTATCRLPWTQPPWRGQGMKTGAGSPVLTPAPLLTCHPLCSTPSGLHLRQGLCLLRGAPKFQPLVGLCVWGPVWARLHRGTAHGLGGLPGMAWRACCTFSLE